MSILPVLRKLYPTGEIYANDNSTSSLATTTMIITMGMIQSELVEEGRSARVPNGLILQDGQNYVYLRHVYMERPEERDSGLKLSSCQAQPIRTELLLKTFREIPAGDVFN